MTHTIGRTGGEWRGNMSFRSMEIGPAGLSLPPCTFILTHATSNSVPMYQIILTVTNRNARWQRLLWTISRYESVKRYSTGQIIRTDMRRLTTGIRSEKCVVRRFRCCANVIEYTYTDLDSTVQPTTNLGYMVQPIAPRLQICAACYCTEYCRQL